MCQMEHTPLIDVVAFVRFYSILSTRQAVGALYPNLSGAMRTLRLTGGTTHDQRRNKEEGEGLTQGCGPH